MPVSPRLAIFLLVSALAAVWLYRDYRSRAHAARWERIAWSLGTLVALPIFLPIYLIAARLPGRLIRCPSCGRATIAHHAACRHCGNAIAFEPPPRKWGLGEVVGIGLVFMLTLPIVATAVGFEGKTTLAELSGFGLVQNALFIGLTIYVGRVRYRLPLRALGIRLERWQRWSVAALIIGVLAVAAGLQTEKLAIAVVGLLIGRGNAERLAEEEHLSDLLTGILQEPLAWTELAWIFILVCVMVPVAEEMFFRGFVYGALRRWGAGGATVISALFFSGVHQQIVHFLPIFVLAVIMALTYDRTGSLLPPIVIHAINNVVATLSTLYGWNI